MKRRTLLRRMAAGLGFAALAFADDRTDALDAITPLATALANSDPDAFDAALPKDLPNRAVVRTNLDALTAHADVTSSVDVISAEKGSAELDWYMRIRSRETSMVLEERRGTVRIAWNKKKKLTLLEPASFFAPPKE